MAQYQDIFKRYEKKYLLTEPQYQALLVILQEQMTPDSHDQYTICNLYYDTPSFQLIRASIEKPVYKEKLRLRSYGVPNAEDTVFLELKKKYDGIVYKRRAKMSLSEADHYLTERKKPEKNGQILREIDWFLDFYQPEPKTYISYDRMAFFGRENSNLRITFDTNIRWRENSLFLGDGVWGDSLLEKGVYLMEIKMPNAMPVWLSHSLDRLEIFPTSFSKYGNCYKHRFGYSPMIGGSHFA